MEKKDIMHYDDNDFEYEFKHLDLFNIICPISSSMLIKLIYNLVINKVCKECSNPEQAFNKIKEIRENPGKFKEKYSWKEISLVDLFNADYNFLIKNFIINKTYVPDENFFRQRFYYQDFPQMIYPFSIKDYYPIKLNNIIEYKINEYYEDLEEINFIDNSKSK